MEAKIISTLVGTVEEIMPSSWIISGKTVHVSDDVTIKGTVIVGDQVSAKVTLDENAEYWTSQIELISHGTSVEGDEPPQAGEDSQNLVEFSGTVEILSLESWTVSGQLVTVTPQSVIKGNIRVGKTVLIQAYSQDDGSFVARQ